MFIGPEMVLVGIAAVACLKLVNGSLTAHQHKGAGCMSKPKGTILFAAGARLQPSSNKLIRS